TRYDRKQAAYFCCLHQAGFPVPKDFKVKFQGAAEINELVRKDIIIDPSKGITLPEATIWFTRVWENYKEWKYLKDYAEKKGHEWADEELRAVLGMLTRHKEPGSSSLVSGYNKLKRFINLHSEKSKRSFEVDIVEHLRNGKIVIIDLSQGDPDI